MLRQSGGAPEGPSAGKRSTCRAAERGQELEHPRTEATEIGASAKWSGQNDGRPEQLGTESAEHWDGEAPERPIAGERQLPGGS